METFIKSKILNNSPIVLLLGQSYYHANPYLIVNETLKKYSPNSDIDSYDSLFSIPEKNKENALGYMNALSEQMPLTNDLSVLGNVAWSCVYTSAIDSFLQNVFENKGRTTRSIYSSRSFDDTRNRTNLAIAYLFGKVSQTESDKIVPLTKIGKNIKKRSADDLLKKLPEILTTEGILLIDGFTEKDWLTTEQLIQVADSLGTKQLFMFSASEALIADENIAYLKEKGNLWTTSMPLAQFLRENDVSTSSFDQSIETEDTNRWILIGDEKRAQIPLNIWNSTIKTARSSVSLKEMYIKRGFRVRRYSRAMAPVKTSSRLPSQRASPRRCSRPRSRSSGVDSADGTVSYPALTNTAVESLAT